MCAGSALQVLKLTNNDILYVPYWITKLHSLNELYLDGNNKISSIPDLSPLTSLTRLSVKSKALPSSLQCTTIKHRRDVKIFCDEIQQVFGNMEERRRSALCFLWGRKYSNDIGAIPLDVMKIIVRMVIFYHQAFDEGDELEKLMQGKSDDHKEKQARRKMPFLFD